MPSCSYKIDSAMEIETRSDRVLSSRKLTLELLLARCPESTVVRELASEYGIETPRFEKDNDDCIPLRPLREGVPRADGRRGAEHGRQRLEPEGVPAIRQEFAGMHELWPRALSSARPTASSCRRYTPERSEENPSQFDEKLTKRGNVFFSYPQQIPKVPVIDPENCVRFKTGETAAPARRYARWVR